MKKQPIFKTDKGQKAIISEYDILLKRWPVPYEQLTIPTRHGNTFIIACGSKSFPPLILLHGSSTNSAMWMGDVAEFSLHYRVYAVDIPGEPGKSEAVRYELNGSDYAEWLNEIFNSLNLTKASLIGISLGGWMSLKFSTAYPERVEKLVLLCPSGIGPQKTSFMLTMLPFIFMGQWGLKQIIKRINGKEIVPDEVIQFSMLVAKNFNPITVNTVFPIFSDEDLKKLNMPVLLLVGDKDVLLHSRITFKRLTMLVPLLTAKLLPDTGHIIINKTGQIIEFLTKE